MVLIYIHDFNISNFDYYQGTGQNVEYQIFIFSITPHKRLPSFL